MKTIFRFGFRAMGSSCEVILASGSKQEGQATARFIIDEVTRIEKKYSRYRPASIVSRINDAAGGDWVECDSETMALFRYADTLYESSGGLFDITSGILRKAWDFRKAVVPEPATLSALLALIDWKSVERKDNAIRLPKRGMQLDFGGFGKEYAADRAASIMHAKGVRNGYVNLGGDVRVVGPKLDETSWMIGIQDPRHKNRMIATLPLYAGALATSGDYERYFESEGHRYCHIIHPRSGLPVTFWRSVTVVAPLTVTAGSFSTIAMLSEAGGLDFLENSGLSYLAIDQSGEIHHKSGVLELSQSEKSPS
jgi:thiamine biosynthesis lipoprotein